MTGRAVLTGRGSRGHAGPRKPRLLVISFSPIANDARVLKQVRLFSPTHELTTLGYGPAPRGVAEHIRVPDDLLNWRLDRRLLIERRFEEAQARQEVVAWARQRLVPGSFDAVLANDAEAVPLALWLRPPGGVHADLHEYAPRQKEGVPRWRLFVAPYVRWLCRTYVTRADSVTTVATSLADEYAREFGFRAGVVVNATPFRDGTPTLVGSPLRLVHSGASLPDRHLEVMVEAMGLITTDATLDLYLTENDPAVIADLRERAAALPDGRVRVFDPVPYAELVETLAAYDVGVFALQPVSFNYRYALPNKLFDFVQARLATIVTPNPEMKRLVEEHGLGLVTAGYSARDLADAIDSFDGASVARAKIAADRAAFALSAERSLGGWSSAIHDLDRRAHEADPSIRVVEREVQA